MQRINFANLSKDICERLDRFKLAYDSAKLSNNEQPAQTHRHLISIFKSSRCKTLENSLQFTCPFSAYPICEIQLFIGQRDQTHFKLHDKHDGVRKLRSLWKLSDELTEPQFLLEIQQLITEWRREIKVIAPQCDFPTDSHRRKKDHSHFTRSREHQN